MPLYRFAALAAALSAILSLFAQDEPYKAESQFGYFASANEPTPAQLERIASRLKPAHERYLTFVRTRKPVSSEEFCKLAHEEHCRVVYGTDKQRTCQEAEIRPGDVVICGSTVTKLE